MLEVGEPKVEVDRFACEMTVENPCKGEAGTDREAMDEEFEVAFPLFWTASVLF